MNIPNSYINQVSQSLNFETKFLKKVNNNIYLTQEEIDLLTISNIPYQNVSYLSELIMLVENVYEEENYPEDLEYLLQVLSERNYYQNTRK